MCEGICSGSWLHCEGDDSTVLAQLSQKESPHYGGKVTVRISSYYCSILKSTRRRIVGPGLYKARVWYSRPLK